jgi:hypothetical protein
MRERITPVLCHRGVAGICGALDCLCLSSDLPLFPSAATKPITRTGCYEQPHCLLSVYMILK